MWAEAQNCFSIVKSRDINFKVRNLIVTAIGQNQLRKHIKIILSINKSQAYFEQAKRKGEIIAKGIIVLCMYASKVIFFIAASMRCFLHLFIAQNTCVCFITRGQT